MNKFDSRVHIKLEKKSDTITFEWLGTTYTVFYLRDALGRIESYKVTNASDTHEYILGERIGYYWKITPPGLFYVVPKEQEHRVYAVWRITFPDGFFVYVGNTVAVIDQVIDNSTSTYIFKTHVWDVLKNNTREDWIRYSIPQHMFVNRVHNR